MLFISKNDAKLRQFSASVIIPSLKDYIVSKKLLKRYENKKISEK